MLVVCWSVKGGVGVTTIAAALGVVGAPGAPEPVTIVDLTGDVPACLGADPPGGPGVAEWLAAGEDTPPDALSRLHHPLADGLELVPRGTGPLSADRAGLLAQVLTSTGRTVVVDAGRADRCPVSRRLAAEADRSLLISRLCAIGIGRALRLPARPTGVVVLRERGRLLGPADVERSTGTAVVADLAVDPAVARAVDAGLLHARLPRSARSAMAAVLR